MERLFERRWRPGKAPRPKRPAPPAGPPVPA